MTRGNNTRKPNGHAGPHGRDNATGGRLAANGHGPASTERGGIPVHRDQAASDDASGASVASAATSAAAGADREACAEAAPSPPNGAAHEPAGKKPRAPSKSKKIPPGEGPLPESPGDFVNEIHGRIDLFRIWHGLLKSKDVKIKQRAVERLTDMRYKGAAASEEEPQQVVADIDSAVARRAAQGAKK